MGVGGQYNAASSSLIFFAAVIAESELIFSFHLHFYGIVGKIVAGLVVECQGRVFGVWFGERKDFFRWRELTACVLWSAIRAPCAVFP